MDLNMHSAQDAETGSDLSLFTLRSVTDRKALDLLHGDDDKDVDVKHTPTAPTKEKTSSKASSAAKDLNLLDILARGEDEFSNSESDNDEPDGKELKDAVYDSDEETVQRMETDMDYQFKEYCKRRNITERKRRARLGLDEEDKDEATALGLEDGQSAGASGETAGDETDTDSGDESDGGDNKRGSVRKRRRLQQSATREHTAEENDDANPLLTSLSDRSQPSKEEREKRWFSRDSFAALNSTLAAKTTKTNIKAAATSSSSDVDSDADMPRWAHETDGQTRSTKRNRDANGNVNEPGAKRRKIISAAGVVGTEKSENGTGDARRKRDRSNGKTIDNDADQKTQDNDNVVEEVPLEADLSSDEDAVSERLAIGTAMLRRKARSRIINDAYNRYAYNDPPLPDWFANNEAIHNRPQLPVTKQQVDEFKEKLKAINARPIKKIAEARARKKKKTEKRWEKIKTQATNIAASEGMSASEKIRNIERLYAKKEKKKEKREKTYVISKRGGGGVETKSKSKDKKKGPAGKTRIKRVDSRLKKDSRSIKRLDKKRKKRK